jgi:hypothetical protein
LPEASCKACQKIISREIETPVIRQEWGAFRAKRQLPTRKPKNRQKHIVIRNQNDDPSATIPVIDHATPVPLYKFDEARILNGLGPGADDLRWTMVLLASHDEEIAMRHKYPQWDGTHRIKVQPYPFARLLAKIGHGYATAELGIDAFTPLTCDLIRGLSDDYFYTVGGSWDIPPPVNRNHITDISIKVVNPGRALLRVDIRLFPTVGTPIYHVIAGEIDFQRPDQPSAFERHRLNGRIKIVPSIGS